MLSIKKLTTILFTSMAIFFAATTLASPQVSPGGKPSKALANAAINSTIASFPDQIAPFCKAIKARGKLASCLTSTGLVSRSVKVDGNKIIGNLTLSAQIEAQTQQSCQLHLSSEFQYTYDNTTNAMKTNGILIKNAILGKTSLYPANTVITMTQFWSILSKTLDCTNP